MILNSFQNCLSVNLGLGGMFTMRNGKIKQHVMQDYSDTPLTTEADLNNWLRFFEMETPLTAVGTFVSAETVSNNVLKRTLKVHFKEY